LAANKNNNSIYNAEGWTLIRFKETDKKPFFKIFASWSRDDRWRLSSGSDQAVFIKRSLNEFEIHQSSGSVYVLPISEEGYATHYAMMILEHIINEARKIGVEAHRVIVTDRWQRIIKERITSNKINSNDFLFITDVDIKIVDNV
jgi:hypothetical protein